MGDYSYSRENASKLKTNEIRELYDKRHEPTLCRRKSRKYLKEKLITQTQYTWLASLGCLGQKSKWEVEEYNRLMKLKEQRYETSAGIQILL